MKAGGWAGLGVALALTLVGCGGAEEPAAAPPPAAEQQAAKAPSDNGAARRAATMLQDAMLGAGRALDEATGTRASLARTALQLKAAGSGTSDAIALMSAESYPRSAQLLTAAQHQRGYLEAMETAASSRSRTDVREALRSAQAAGRSASSAYVELGRVAPELAGMLPEASAFGIATLRGATDEALAPSGGATPPARAGSSARTFHAGTGNVTCQVDAEGAACTVASLGETFVLPASGEAYREIGVRLGRGDGERVAYGTSVEVGAVACEIPPENVSRGITCTKGGHGFEASRVESRQKVY